MFFFCSFHFISLDAFVKGKMQFPFSTRIMGNQLMPFLTRINRLNCESIHILIIFFSACSSSSLSSFSFPLFLLLLLFFKLKYFQFPVQLWNFRSANLFLRLLAIAPIDWAMIVSVIMLTVQTIVMFAI